jgi:catechol 2,3-dioxygenase-like lactoylglutathione lyase family enzyme
VDGFGPDVAATQILVVADPARSRDWWVEVLGAQVHREYGSSVVLRLAGAWFVLVTGGGPSQDKPTVTLSPPTDPDVVSHAVTLRVADCRLAHETLRARGGVFLTEPVEHATEVRCFLRDPDGHLVELSEARG